jgi:sec-independent protein translocase protein TatA
MGNIGWTELLLIFLVILLVFGAKRIPEIARGLGKGIREFKDATSDIKKELTVGDQPAPPPHQIGRAGYPPAYGPPASPDQMGYVPPPAGAYTAPAPGQQAPFPDPAVGTPPGTPPAAPPAEGQTPQS